jgi:uncharacterized OB-fold protein
MSTLEDLETLASQYWSAVAEGRFVLQKCASCAALRFPPYPACASCYGQDHIWVEGTGQGILRSWVVTYHVFDPSLEPLVPYTILLVELLDGPGLVMYGLIDSSCDVAPRNGAPVRAVFGEVNGRPVIKWIIE